MSALSIALGFPGLFKDPEPSRLRRYQPGKRKYLGSKPKYTFHGRTYEEDTYVFQQDTGTLHYVKVAGFWPQPSSTHGAGALR
jgi:hypothetical protein